MKTLKRFLLLALFFHGNPLASDFEQNLTLWLHEVNDSIYENGKPLTKELQQVAAELGITRPDKIRILIVDEIPTPMALPKLYREGKQRKLWGPDIKGNAQIFGYSIAVTQEVFDDMGKMAHELMHVRQVERFGSLEKFVVEYLRQIEHYGYFDAPLEVEAFQQNSRYGGSQVLEK
ncbi:hypothetical protein QWY20_11885 [Alkalimonas sp. MEB108]|uniref:DUF4157 domain-containing protein n=1 Tax=Alkalimonas cellulosilytica TaxID=3058395 RepID=A0ABU7J6L8_9GAMM|nr:hypothetical protein [Alkalimonas sp. MEB108]MEE2002153.1 hypothetical protein [Alkalimonas sp. MEB108]